MVPPSRSLATEPSTAPMKLLREVPITSGRPSLRNSPSRRSNSKLCSLVFPNPIPGSSQTRSSSIPALDGEFQSLNQKSLYLVDDVLVHGVRLHRPGIPQHVHQHNAGSPLGAKPRHPRISPQRGHVVDDRSAAIKRRFGDRGLGSVDRNCRGPGQGSDNGPHPPKLLPRIDRLRPRPSRLPPYIQNLRPIPHKLLPMRDSRLGIQV